MEQRQQEMAEIFYDNGGVFLAYPQNPRALPQKQMRTEGHFPFAEPSLPPSPGYLF